MNLEDEMCKDMKVRRILTVISISVFMIIMILTIIWAISD